MFQSVNACLQVELEQGKEIDELEKKAGSGKGEEGVLVEDAKGKAKAAGYDMARSTPALVTGTEALLKTVGPSWPNAGTGCRALSTKSAAKADSVAEEKKLKEKGGKGAAAGEEEEVHQVGDCVILYAVVEQLMVTSLVVDEDDIAFENASVLLTAFQSGMAQAFEGM
ncbi:hypothetical protein CYMTET_40429 [Cymbomonas tetramitiformis]|uniref:Uncharacterized protein n=1 Tax=Cymbomonas tetramitiformis TaxID=36881 RepID=A0AAE0C952_9CHLO|nr:hypothetical protein CYMTET_40429 [Cymbomonas tetramitiformis]